jgi:hypothetical protein
MGMSNLGLWVDYTRHDMAHPSVLWTDAYTSKSTAAPIFTNQTGKSAIKSNRYNLIFKINYL